VGEGLTLTNQVTPDINVEVTADQEKAHFADPFKRLTAASATEGIPSPESSVRTNRGSRPRMNEAELVRRRREQQSLGDLPVASARPDSAPEEKVLMDAALVRALDVLKGIAVVGATPAAR
jgi:hypothetical protein